MGNGLDWAGYKQVSGDVPTQVLTSTSGNTSAPAAGWYKAEILTSDVQLAGITGGDITGSSLITSGTTFFAPKSWPRPTAVNVSANSSGKVLCYERILI